MNFSFTRILTTLAVILVPAGVALCWCSTGAPDCGGNNAALANCSRYVMTVSAWSRDHDGRAFSLYGADGKAREELQQLAKRQRITKGRLLARTGPISIEHSEDATAPRRVILVCERPYDNVRLQPAGKPAPAHAVAWSTGETGLISPEDFAKLDLGNFTDVREIVRDNSPATEKPPWH